MTARTALAPAALLLLVLGTALAAAALRSWRWLDVPAAAAATAGAVAWLLGNGPWEGVVLVVLLPGDGVTTSDLLVLPAVVLTALLVLRRLQDRR